MVHSVMPSMDSGFVPPPFPGNSDCFRPLIAQWLKKLPVFAALGVSIDVQPSEIESQVHSFDNVADLVAMRRWRWTDSDGVVTDFDRRLTEAAECGLTLVISLINGRRIAVNDDGTRGMDLV